MGPWLRGGLKGANPNRASFIRVAGCSLGRLGQALAARACGPKASGSGGSQLGPSGYALVGWAGRSGCDEALQGRPTYPSMLLLLLRQAGPNC
jgi:hypothetical protein